MIDGIRFVTWVAGGLGDRGQRGSHRVGVAALLHVVEAFALVVLDLLVDAEEVRAVVLVLRR